MIYRGFGPKRGSKKGLILDPILTPFWAYFDPILGPVLTPFRYDLSGIWPQKGVPKWTPKWAYFDPILGPKWPILTPFWAQNGSKNGPFLGPFLGPKPVLCKCSPVQTRSKTGSKRGPKLGPKWSIFGPIFEPKISAMQMLLGPKWVQKWVQKGPQNPKMGPKWVIFGPFLGRYWQVGGRLYAYFGPEAQKGGFGG